MPRLGKGTPKKTESPVESNQDCNSGGDESVQIHERPRICLIDLDDECVQTFKSHGFNCYSGTLGSLVEVPNRKSNDQHRCLPNFDFPLNLHEYDIVVIDLQSPTKVAYILEEHIRTGVKGHKELFLLSSFPETLFDPRAFAATLLKSRLRPLMEKESVLIVFAARAETVEYHSISITPGRSERLSPETHSSYDFYQRFPTYKNVTGQDTIVVVNKGTEIGSLLEQHNGEASYSIIFDHPTHKEGSERVKDKDFRPLIEAKTGGIVAFVHSTGKNSFTFFLPHIRRKAAFLTDLFETVLPRILPSLFPNSTQFAWLDDPKYRLPNEDALLQEKEQLEDEYETKMKALEARIDANRQEYDFLHDLLIQSGQDLVKTLENYLRWLGFEDVVNVDETNPELQEEDLRVETDCGLLIIEIKGIGGTSTDSECAQISKVKYRRAKERGTFDVFALYIVNHQLHLPAEQRRNPPFNETQIDDARSADRGLLTTYDLFKLYFSVSNGHISKEDARCALFQTGLVTFKPSSSVKVPGPLKIHHGGYVVTFSAEGFSFWKDMSVILCDEGRCRSASIVEIQVNRQLVEEVNAGEVGIKLSEKVFKGTELWVRQEAR